VHDSLKQPCRNVVFDLFSTNQITVCKKKGLSANLQTNCQKCQWAKYGSLQFIIEKFNRFVSRLTLNKDVQIFFQWWFILCVCNHIQLTKICFLRLPHSTLSVWMFVSSNTAFTPKASHHMPIGFDSLTDLLSLHRFYPGLSFCYDGVTVLASSIEEISANSRSSGEVSWFYTTVLLAK